MISELKLEHRNDSLLLSVYGDDEMVSTISDCDKLGSGFTVWDLGVGIAPIDKLFRVYFPLGQNYSLGGKLVNFLLNGRYPLGVRIAKMGFIHAKLFQLKKRLFVFNPCSVVCHYIFPSFSNVTRDFRCKRRIAYQTSLSTVKSMCWFEI